MSIEEEKRRAGRAAAQLDVRVGNFRDPSRFDQTLLAIPGVLATGLFCDIAAVAVLADGEAVNVLRVD